MSPHLRELERIGEAILMVSANDHGCRSCSPTGWSARRTSRLGRHRGAGDGARSVGASAGGYLLHETCERHSDQRHPSYPAVGLTSVPTTTEAGAAPPGLAADRNQVAYANAASTPLRPSSP